MNREHDVIVVGAGPAGALTATALALKGRDVLLIDRDQFPRDKICGDAVPVGAIELLHQMGMEEKIQHAVDRGEFYPLNKMLLVSPKGHSLTAEFTRGTSGGDSFIAPRIHFDAVIQQHAVDSGAHFCQAQVTKPILEQGWVKGVKARMNGESRQFRSKVVIGADGVTSAIARSLRPKSERHVDAHRAVALRAYIEGIEEIPHTVEFYLYREILPGYAWIFPTGPNQANVGLGMRLDKFRNGKQKLEQMLESFLQMPEIRKRIAGEYKLRDVATWQLNFGSQKQMHHVFDGALLVGDAAGFVNPLTGGGIHNSLVSATLAADTVETALLSGDSSRAGMVRYEQLCHEHMWSGMKRSYRLQRLLMNFPFVIDFLIRRMSANNQFARMFLTKL